VLRTERWFPAIREIADNVNLLDLPQDIQDRVHRGKITYDKAWQLTILTREPSTTTVVHEAGRGHIIAEPQPAQRTDRWFPAIREIADNVNLQTEKEIAKTAQLVREAPSLTKPSKKRRWRQRKNWQPGLRLRLRA